MTNKINGIDESEYPFFDKNTFNGECAKNSRALYKWLLELKRLQANCGEKYLSPDGAELYDKNVQLKEENKKLKDENSHKSNLIWYIYHCNKLETIQRLLYEYYECINDDRYNEKRVKKFWNDIFHLQQRKKYKSKYKQALEEIKNLAELEVMLDKNSKAFYPANIQRILDVIKEVMNER